MYESDRICRNVETLLEICCSPAHIQILSRVLSGHSGESKKKNEKNQSIQAVFFLPLTGKHPGDGSFPPSSSDIFSALVSRTVKVDSPSGQKPEVTSNYTTFKLSEGE